MDIISADSGGGGSFFNGRLHDLTGKPGFHARKKMFFPFYDIISLLEFKMPILKYSMDFYEFKPVKGAIKYSLPPPPILKGLIYPPLTLFI